MRALLVTLTLAIPSTCQSLSSALSQLPNLSTFTRYLNDTPKLLSQIDSGNYTVFAPTNDAINAYLSANVSQINETITSLEALLSYHVVDGSYSQYDLSGPPQFLPTLLTNTSYANVTGGQRVQARGVGTNVTLISGLNTTSTIVSPDILLSDGFLHVIDTVLQIPVTPISTVSAENWQYFTVIFAEDETLGTAFSSLVANLTALEDMTYFATNSRAVAEGFRNGTYNNGDTTSSALQYVEYNCIRGAVLYTPLLENGATFQTVQGNNITITVVGNDTFVNSAKVIGRDYLVSNGVAQVIDNVLDYNDTEARPALSKPTSAFAPDIASSTPSNHGQQSSATALSSGGKAGIAIGAVVLSAVVGAAAFFFIMRRKRMTAQTPGHSGREQYNPGPSEADPSKHFAEMSGIDGCYAEMSHDRMDALELHHDSKPAEFGSDLKTTTSELEGGPGAFELEGSHKA